MGRRNETNRLAFKKKVDNKKEKEKNSQETRKEKLKQIISKFNNEKKQLTKHFLISLFFRLFILVLFDIKKNGTKIAQK